MKKIALCTLAAFTLLACKKNEGTDDTTTAVDTMATTDNSADTAKTSDAGADFDINTVPVSTHDLGKFPYLNAPDTYTYNYDKINPGDISEFDKEYFAVNGKLILQEGKTCKVFIQKPQGSGAFNSLVVEKSYEKAILALGGVQVNNVAIPKSEIERIGNKELIDNKHGFSLDYNLLDDVKTFVIRTKDKEVWIQFSLMNNESGKITILEKGNLETVAVTTITADSMKKDIDANGKSILNINFDTDKASLTADGQEIVNEIAKLLKANPKLKLSIEGHTDNTGNAAKNKTLSVDRATTVMNYLVAVGIPKANLKATGFGADKPLAPNTSDINKAKNRRVELVKF